MKRTVCLAAVLAVVVAATCVAAEAPKAVTAAGNEVEFFAYPCDCVPGLTGHCIWRPLFRSKKLIPHLETRIADFVRHVRGRVSEKKDD